MSTYDIGAFEYYDMSGNVIIPVDDPLCVCMILFDATASIDQTVIITNNLDISLQVFDAEVTGYGVQVGVKSNDISISTFDVTLDYEDEDRPIKNDRLINLKTYLPNAFYESDVYEFIKLFEDHWNETTYDYRIEGEYRPISVLKKIEMLRSLRDQDIVDWSYLNDMAQQLGYLIRFDKKTLGTFSNSIATSGTIVTQYDSNRYIRHTIRELPSWYAIKGTDFSITSILFMYGIVAEVYTYWTNDYRNNWEIEYPTYEEGDETPVIPKDYYPTPHFYIGLSPAVTEDWLNEVEKLRDFIDSIRPVNTVFEGFAIASKSELVLVPYDSISTEYIIEILSEPLSPP